MVDADPAVTDRSEDRLDRGDVAGAAALRHEPAARSEDAGKVPEERIVVGHPVERRGREDRVDGRDGQRLAEVGDDVLDAIAEALESVARGLDHRGRSVEGDHAPVRQPLGQHLGHPAAPAARIEDAFVAREG